MVDFPVQKAVDTAQKLKWVQISGTNGIVWERSGSIYRRIDRLMGDTWEYFMSEKCNETFPSGSCFDCDVYHAPDGACIYACGNVDTALWLLHIDIGIRLD